MSIPSFIVDAFTRQPFSGNPAAVCLLDRPRDNAWLQAVAAEFNLSETAFLLPLGQDQWQLSWFTPVVEVDLCGHATLASAHVLWQETGVTAPVLRFSTRSGELRAKRVGDQIELDFPIDRPRPLGLKLRWDAMLGAEAVTVMQGRDDILVQLESEEQVRELKPDMNAIAQLFSRGVMVTARAKDTDADFVSRFFAPAAGINEDPVTGSAHCLLGPYWSGILGKTRMRARQLSSRGGELDVELQGDRVLLRGHATTTLKGQLHVE